MALLQLVDATKKYPEKLIFEDISLQIQKKDRVGLIGANGTGKSTLIKILEGRKYLDQGEILTSNDLEVGYLAQNFELNLDNTLYQEMLSVFKGIFVLEEKIRSLESEMSQVSGDELDKVMNRYGKLRQKFEDKNGYQYESRIKGILRGLGFSDENFSDQIINFSGGQKTRAALARLLLQQPDLLLLDEPTNHLDLKAKEWLENYLNDYSGAVIVISHDRYFLDEVVNRIWELEKGRLEKYNGNYSFYLKEKPRKLLSWKRKYEQQQEKIKKMKAYIRKYKAGIKSKQARGRQKKLERMTKIPPPPSLEQPKIEFNLATNSGEEVLKVNNLAKSYDQELLFEDVNFRLYRGDKVALVGPNGSGKSTLFKLLVEKEKADTGNIKLGTRVKMGYYEQEHKDLTSNYNLIEEMKKIKDMTTSKARDILARFLFKGDDVFKKIFNLSGGEKARLSLAKLSAQDYNFLLLDEPTNHLDIKAKEILEEALQNYSGTLLIISHDRYFLNQVVDKVFAIQDNHLVEYLGGYSDYREQYEKLLTNQKKIKKKTREVEEYDDDEKEENIDLEEVETKIIELENKVENLEDKFNSQQLYEDSEKLSNLTKEYEEIKEKLNYYYNLWENAI